MPLLQGVDGDSFARRGAASGGAFGDFQRKIDPSMAPGGAAGGGGIAGGSGGACEDLATLLAAAGLQLGDASDLAAEGGGGDPWGGQANATNASGANTGSPGAPQSAEQSGADGAAAGASVPGQAPASVPPAGGPRRQSLIVVASLVDKVPNLAGLCRTCEVFRAEALALADLKVGSLLRLRSASVCLRCAKPRFKLALMFYCMVRAVRLPGGGADARQIDGERTACPADPIDRFDPFSMYARQWDVKNVPCSCRVPHRRGVLSEGSTGACRPEDGLTD